ncbi:hypothetical protein Ngar_c35450 [Candidatus Nitrososphaera gargensis Ga9.2]|uniref:Uncharacterized protein n=1 Tax=Nitrososphaera gargensis (strain Ga9.2) TaxID=1237085 RepID=K0ILJ3_NITGG|nr:hypothetical protein Ngar_c35450 [Candidatus Nitrososphaera gargensis Ga9.2]
MAKNLILSSLEYDRCPKGLTTNQGIPREINSRPNDIETRLLFGNSMKIKCVRNS